METLDLDIATEFLLIAATLVELKTRRLLPGDDDVDLDDELALWEERDLLLARLLECKTFKDAAVALQQPGRRGRPLLPPRRRPRRAVPRPHPRPARRRRRPTTCAPAFLRAVTPKPQARDRPRPRRARSGRSVADAVVELARRAAPRRPDHRSASSPARSSSGSRSSCASSPCSSCSSRASSTSTSPAPSATSRSSGSGGDRSELADLRRRRRLRRLT